MPVATRSLAGFCSVLVKDIQLENAIRQVHIEGCGWHVLSVLSSPWVMLLAMSIEVVYSRCRVGEVEASLRVMLMLRSYNHIEYIPLEGLSSGTYSRVACIRIFVMLCARWILPSTGTEAVHSEVCSRSSLRSVDVSEERRGRRTLAVALSRHRVGLKKWVD